MNRFLVFVVTILLFVAITSASGGYVGVSSQCINQQCFMAASTSLISIALGIGFLIYAIKFPRKIFGLSSHRTGAWRRFGAFILDFMVILLSLTPIIVLPALIAEYFHTDSFVWFFQRAFARSSDTWVVLPSVLIMFGGLFYYFYRYCALSKQTLGQYVFGYHIVAEKEGMTAALARKRVLISMLGLCLWPITVIHGLYRKRVFWWDSASETQAVNIETVNKNQNEMDGSVEPPI